MYGLQVSRFSLLVITTISIIEPSEASRCSDRNFTLSEEYDPSTNPSDPLEVRFSFYGHAVKEIDDTKFQVSLTTSVMATWNDSRMTDCSGEISSRWLEKVWRPDIRFFNAEKVEISPNTGETKALGSLYRNKEAMTWLFEANLVRVDNKASSFF